MTLLEKKDFLHKKYKERINTLADDIKEDLERLFDANGQKEASILLDSFLSFETNRVVVICSFLHNKEK